MSSEQVATKAKETWRAVKDILEKAEDTVHKELSKAAPAVQKSLDASLEGAAKGFGATMKKIDARTEREQLELLKAYKRFLSGQVDFVEAKLKSLENRADSKKQDPPPSN